MGTDSLVAAAARALAAGEALGALKRIALRDDPPALALRGIAMAQALRGGAGAPPTRRESTRRGAIDPKFKSPMVGRFPRPRDADSPPVMPENPCASKNVGQPACQGDRP
jgi:hypothetical protein